jgi:hypothetical protein
LKNKNTKIKELFFEIQGRQLIIFQHKLSSVDAIPAFTREAAGQIDCAGVKGFLGHFPLGDVIIGNLN